MFVLNKVAPLTLHDKLQHVISLETVPVTDWSPLEHFAANTGMKGNNSLKFPISMLSLCQLCSANGDDKVYKKAIFDTI